MVILRIRVQFNISCLGHALSTVDILYSFFKIIPDLVKADLFQPVGIRRPVGSRHGAISQQQKISTLMYPAPVTIVIRFVRPSFSYCW